MAKAQLVFDLDIPEDKEEFKHAQKGSTYKWIIEDIWESVFRPYVKYGIPENMTKEELLEAMAEKYRNIVHGGLDE